MSQPSELEIQQLRQVINDWREVHEERGHRIDVAVAADPAFGSSMSRSWLARDLTVAALSEAASQRGLDFRPVKGLGREFRFHGAGFDRRYRLKKATKSSDGSYEVLASSDSALAVEDEGLLFAEELWVLAYTLTAEYLLQDVFIARILGFEEGPPGHLVLGRLIELLGSTPPPDSFQPSDEDLFGFDDEDEQEGDVGF